MPRKKGMTSEVARGKKMQGHRAEYEFAELIGGEVIKGRQKPDVRDQCGNLYSVKAGKKKWQIFLYGENRFLTDVAFSDAGVADALVGCLRAFPPTHNDYERNKARYKEALKASMRELCKALSHPGNLKAFLCVSFFADGVTHLAIKQSGEFHVFHADEALDILSRLNVENSQARAKNQVDCQKVVFKWKTVIGEIEIRHDPKNYRKAKFWMHKDSTLQILQSNIPSVKESRPGLRAYGRKSQEE